LLCQSKDAALAVQRQTEGEGVTLDGTKYSHKGSLSGGFIDETRSKYRIYKQWHELNEQLDAIKSEFVDCEEQHASIIEQKKKILSQLEQARSEVQSLSGDKSTSQVERKQKLLDKSISQKDKLERLIETCEKDIRNEEAAMDAITSADGIRADDRDKKIADLSARRNQCADKLLAAQDVESKLQSSFTSFQERQETIVLRLSEIEKIISSNSVSPSQLKLIRAAAKAAHDELADLRTRLAVLDSDKAKQVNNRRHIRERLEKLLEEERALEAEMSKLNMRARVALDKSAAARKEMDEFRSRNQKLGAPPRDASEFQRLSLKELVKGLSDVSADIKKFDHLNRKAISQFQRLQQEKDDFSTKLKEAEQSHAAVLKLIEKLDQDKDQKISDFFKKVDQHFRRIFPVIVPGGSGELVLLVHSGKQRTWSGVGIKVTLPGVNDGQTMNNLLLSGGQQSVVALALIFSIQQCDPMPFYVFDEIDASLDPTYRMQVAKFIKDMSHHPTSPCQFICTTFREEIVKVADAWFLVEFRNDMSVVSSSDKSQALKLILDEKKHSDRAGGGAAEPSGAGRGKRVRAVAVTEDKENFDGDD